MSDLRRLPDEVRSRLEARYGPELFERRHAGFDVDITFRGGTHTVERRDHRQIEIRQDSDDDTAQPVIAGYATTYDQPYDMYGGPEEGGWVEVIAEGAAKKSIEEQDEVKALFDHEGLPLGTTKAGTLELKSDKTGLYTETTPDVRSPWSLEIVSRVERGELDAMSFAFQVMRQEWDDEMTHRTIREVRLFDVSVVSFPANPNTSVGLVEPKAKSGRSLRLARAQLDQLVS